MNKEVILDYSGEFRFETIELLLSLVRDKINQLEIKTGIKKKVVNILVECLENIYKYTTLDKENDYGNSLFTSKITLERTAEAFIITSGNTILNKNIEKLKQKIDQVNSLDKDGLQKLYEDIINNNEISEKGGAGLGIIDIALKSNNKLHYNFTSLDENCSFYELIVNIQNGN
ncbi:MAG: hypothetical protein A2275_04455 [Bacteroidetes bacterium RIFOXYA12_FULL_35_11]|nr:MAG: hypothetical protein A2X01_07765 [Bacteroidetes bacterium GWF2_35_48]OFY75562.1 MAG: hypothetical protein A2275_04455 [Bacteroidetes bacterium RIFOXYA12_FULL_35_11]OFY99158.1 MAG: hypothetical protein A2491_12970 [Bacteroidetes bacterium RIFOXYC12_FULL_35_7]HBX49802.1 hypothetical protein [Bacteroidales bacterium]